MFKIFLSLLNGCVSAHISLLSLLDSAAIRLENRLIWTENTSSSTLKSKFKHALKFLLSKNWLSADFEFFCF
jgi:hypothetical protein